MDNLARTLDTGAVTHEAGSVVAASRAGLKVETSSGTFLVKRAASCLLEPKVGDLVEMSLVAGGGGYVVAVLEREAGAASRIAVDGDLELAPKGRLRAASTEGIELVSEEDVQVVAGRVAVRAVDLSATFDRLTSLGRFVHQQVDKVRSVSTTVDLVAERLTQTVDRCYRFVAESDTLRAGRVDMQAAEILRVHANNSVVTAEQLVKLDGGQIHMG
jgi:hypothetical protein